MIDDWVVPQETNQSNDDWVVPDEVPQPPETSIANTVINAVNTIPRYANGLVEGVTSTIDNRREIASKINASLGSAQVGMASALGQVGTASNDFFGYEGKDVITDFLNNYVKNNSEKASKRLFDANATLRAKEANQLVSDEGKLVREAGTSVFETGLPMLLGGASKSVLTGVAAMMPQVFGQNYEALKAQGEGERGAVTHGAAKSAIEGVSEILPMKYLLKVMPGQLSKKLASMTLIEGGTEMASSLANSLYDSYTTNPNVDWGKAWDEAVHSFKVGAVAGGMTGGAVTLPGAINNISSKITENTTKKNDYQNSMNNIETNRAKDRVDTQQAQAAQDVTIKDIQGSLADVMVPQEIQTLPGANVQADSGNTIDYRKPDMTDAILQDSNATIENQYDSETRTTQYQNGINYEKSNVTPDSISKSTTSKSAADYQYDNGVNYEPKVKKLKPETPGQTTQKSTVESIEYTPEKDTEIDNTNTEKVATQQLFGNEIEFESNNKTKSIEKTKERLTKKLGDMTHEQVKALAVDAKLVRAKTDSKEALTTRIIALREAVDTLKQYETLNEVHDAIDSGDISKEQIAQWTTAVSKKGTKISPINTHLNLASVTAWARSNAGLKLPFTPQDTSSDYFDDKPDATKAMNFSRPFRPQYLRKKVTKKFRDTIAMISSTTKGGSLLFPVDDNGNIKGFDTYRDAFKQMQKMDDKLKTLDAAQTKNPDTDPKQLLDLYKKSYNLWASIQNASFYHGDNVNRAIRDEMVSRNKQQSDKQPEMTEVKNDEEPQTKTQKPTQENQEEIEQAVSEIMNKHSDTAFYSTPIEPIIKELVALLQDSYGWGKKQITEFVDNIGEEGKDFIETIASVTKVPKAVFQIAKVITMPNKHMLNGMYQSTGVKAFKTINDSLFAPVGEDAKAVSDPYETAVDRRVTTNINKLAKILEPFDNTKNSLDQVVRLIRNPGNIIPGTTVHDAALAIGELMDAEKTYQDEAGIEQGEVLDGYFPRQLDMTVVRKKRNQFLSDAKQAYRDTDKSLSQDDAAKKAREWLYSAELGDAGVSRTGYDFVTMNTGMPLPNSSKKRTLSKEADNTLADYFNNDPVEVLGSYFVSSARRSEFIKRFGSVLWGSLKAEIIDSGHADMLDDVVRIIESATGIMPKNLPEWAGNATSFLRVLTALTYLPHATITSLSELALPIVRSGDIRVVARNLITTTRELVKSTKNDELRYISEMILGVTGNISTEMLLAQRFGGQFEGKKSQMIMNRFFHKTGLHRFTEATRIGTLQVSRTFMSGLAKDIVNNSSRKKSAEMLLKELGVPANKLIEFVEQIQQHKDGIVGKETLEQDDWFSETYQQAMVRFTEQTIMNPKASERPLYANHPVGAFSYSLMSFLYSFHVNVLERAGKMALSGASIGNGLSIGDRARMFAPMVGLILPMIIQFALGESKDRLRETVYGTKAKEKSDTDKWITAFSRAGLLGIADPLVNMYTGAKYNRDPATMMSGAVLGGIGGWIQALMGVTSSKNSGNTNSAERKLAKVSYDLSAKPFINLIFTMMPGGSLLTPLAVGGIQLASAKGTSDAVTDTIAGQKAGKSNSRNRIRKRKHRTRNHRSGR